MSSDRPLRSAEWFQRKDMAGFIHRAFTKADGYSDEDLQKPVIGIANTWSEANHCNAHLKGIAEAVKRGVWQAGGLPLEVPTISLSEILLQATTKPFRQPPAIDPGESDRP